eukprot:10068037-Lingulodinium_polyedra.AAC.1
MNGRNERDNDDQPRRGRNQRPIWRRMAMTGAMVKMAATVVVKLNRTMVKLVMTVVVKLD